MYVYIKSEPGLFTVGHYHKEMFVAESDHASEALAARRVRYLNGGDLASTEQRTVAMIAVVLFAHGKSPDHHHAVMQARDILATVYQTEEE